MSDAVRQAILPRAALRLDLHLHSTASDGVLTPTQLVAAASREGLHVIALTDHDSIAGISEARVAGEAAGVSTVAGVELSAHDEEREVHVLGLHLAWLEPLKLRLAELASSRHARAAEMVRRLNEAGVSLTFEEILALAPASALGRPHLARALVAHGWAHDHRDAFERYLQPGRPGYVAKRRLPLPDAITLLHQAGGLAILAHPAPEDSLARLQAFAEQGLDGIEVVHPSLSPDERARLSAAADLLSLVKSGGSDWHGRGDSGRGIGAEHVAASWLDAQHERLAARRPRWNVA